MKIAISGSNGLIGSALVSRLKEEGHTIVVLTRNKKSKTGVYWNPRRKILDATALEGCDAVVHLAGENIAGLRWTRGKKKRILLSRVKSSQLLASAITSLQKRPAVFISASAIGYYGDCGSEIADESSPVGTGFLADVCRDWENAAAEISASGIRTVFLRFGLVLDAKGGALAKMLPAFRCGLGGRIGSGTQYVSWVTLADAVRAAIFCLNRAEVQGPINVVSPMPVTNERFTQSLAAELHKPALLPLPRSAVQLLFGEMGETLLLFSSRVLPRRLLSEGFTFEQENIEQALAAVLRQKAK